MCTWKTGFSLGTILVLLSIIVPGSSAFDIEKDLVFRLYTLEDPNAYQVLKADLKPPTTFNPNRPSRIFIHGFKSKEKVIIRYKDAFLNVGNYNFIAVDWINGADTLNYLKAKARVEPVSRISMANGHRFKIQRSYLINFVHSNRFQRNWLN